MPKTHKKPITEVVPRKTRSLPIGPSWQIQTAKARFSELFRLARTEGPQLITRQGKEGVVMISNECRSVRQRFLMVLGQNVLAA